MKNLLTYLVITFFLVGFTQAADEKTFPVRTPKGEPRKELARTLKKAKKADILRVVTHMPVNRDWTSELTVRSDSGTEIFMVLEFYDAAGLPVEATFLDSFGDEYTGEGFIIEDLQPFEIYSMNFGSLYDARSMQVFVYTNEFETDYGLEAMYHRFRGNFKLASVGVPVLPPGDIFILNLDQRFDPDTLNRKFRGIAVSNNDGLDCGCDITLFNQNGESFDQFGDYPRAGIDIPAFGKWVGTIYDIYPDIDELLADGMGYLLFECDNPVSVLGLAFEFRSNVVASVPIDYFDQAKTKDGVTRIKRKD